MRWRYIGGFGAIHWLDDVALANPFAVENGEVERGMVEHMNDDHAAAIAHYVEQAGLSQVRQRKWPVSTVKASTCVSAMHCIG